ncbi:hypothetical protein MBLNU230_g1446t1 [Neophaeotheca triangularis]
MQTNRVLLASTAALLAGSLPLVTGHGDGHMDMGAKVASNSSTAMEQSPPSYFRDSGYPGWMLAHIALMVVAWVAILPVVIMLSVARSRYSLPGQVVFHTFNGLGVFTGSVYNHATPDLYEKNAHHPIGWVVSALTVVWTSLAIANAYVQRRNGSAHDAPPKSSMTSDNLAHHNGFKEYSDQDACRLSRDSGQGTERNSASLFSSRQNSSDSIPKKENRRLYADDEEHEKYHSDEDSEQQGFLSNDRADRYMPRKLKSTTTPRASSILRISHTFLEKTLLVLGFLAIATGAVTYGGLFRERRVFAGLAHFVKGGIFFWYGLLTLGRWMGAFTEYGWAWNVRPQYPLVSRLAYRMPSAEFVESFVIWLYGASNVFLEHLNGKHWNPMDFEHISITILFFGGGLLGMLVESTRVRDLLNTSALETKHKAGSSPNTDLETATPALWTEPRNYSTPLNPLPALVILILGLMMSSHHQSSHVSTMMHAQWGNLFIGFALTRCLTYILLYLSPPASHLPARPPTELLAAFCLSSGGLVFMGSAPDTVAAVEGNGLDEMFVFTVVMGVTAVVLAWEVAVFAVGGWAVRREKRGIAGVRGGERGLVD